MAEINQLIYTYNMFTEQDKRQIADRGMTVSQVEHQLELLAKGFPFLKLETAASVGHGIVKPSAEQRDALIEEWNAYLAGGHKITKFVPASGAASRMFKNMFAFLNADYDIPQTDFEHDFFDHIHEDQYLHVSYPYSLTISTTLPSMTP